MFEVEYIVNTSVFTSAINLADGVGMGNIK